MVSSPGPSWPPDGPPDGPIARFQPTFDAVGYLGAAPEGTMDRFDYIEERERSAVHIKKLGPELGRIAAFYLEMIPGPHRLAAFIIEDGAVRLDPSLARERRLLGKSGIVGVTKVDSIWGIRCALLRMSGAAMVRDFDAFVASNRGLLPIVSITRHGFRLAAVPIPPFEF